jgi:hypothetical protein
MGLAERRALGWPLMKLLKRVDSTATRIWSTGKSPAYNGRMTWRTSLSVVRSSAGSAR